MSWDSTVKIPPRGEKAKTNEEMRNLFDYATKELSQDAFLRWFIDCWNEEKLGIGQVSRKFIESLTEIEESPSSVKTEAQWENTDIVADIVYSGKTVRLCIEDKVASSTHDAGTTQTNQLVEYGRRLEFWRNERPNERDVRKIYYKTGVFEGNERNIAENADWKIWDILRIADFFVPFLGTSKSQILDDYIRHVQSGKKEQTEISGKCVRDWNSTEVWTAYQKELKPFWADFARKGQWGDGEWSSSSYYHGHYRTACFWMPSPFPAAVRNVCLELIFKDQVTGCLHPLAADNTDRDARTVWKCENPEEGRQQLVDWFTGWLRKNRAGDCPFEQVRRNAKNCFGKQRIPIDANRNWQSVVKDVKEILEAFARLCGSSAPASDPIIPKPETAAVPESAGSVRTGEEADRTGFRNPKTEDDIRTFLQRREVDAKGRIKGLDFARGRRGFFNLNLLQKPDGEVRFTIYAHTGKKQWQDRLNKLSDWPLAPTFPKNKDSNSGIVAVFFIPHQNWRQGTTDPRALLDCGNSILAKLREVGFFA